MRVGSHLPETRFVLIGDDIFEQNTAYRDGLIASTKTSEIAEKIDFAGWKEDMEEVWPTIDCLVHTASHEPFGRVIIEAMAHRIPVIAISGWGPSEIIQNEETGILVKDTESLSKAMIRVAGSPELAKRLACNGQQLVGDRFMADRTAEKIRDIYERMMVA